MSGKDRMMEEVKLQSGQHVTMKDGVEYIVDDRGVLIRLTPRKGKKSRRRAGG